MRPFSPSLLAAFAAVISATTAHAATLSYSPTAPTPGTFDISNFTGTTTDAGNVAGGNDAGTYFGFDRGALGQTFTTGANVGGYLLSTLTLQTATYSTFQRTSFASQLTLRVSTFSAATTLAPFRTENATVTGGEPNQPPQGQPAVGNGNFLTLTLATPVTLAPNTIYAVDVAATGPNFYIETNGTNTDPYAGGQAYHTGLLAGNTSGGTTTAIFDTGDHVFDLALTAVPEPSTWALVLTVLGVGSLTVRRRRKLAV